MLYLIGTIIVAVLAVIFTTVFFKKTKESLDVHAIMVQNQIAKEILAERAKEFFHERHKNK